MLLSLNARQNVPTEWSYLSAKQYDDPFNEVDLDVVFTGPGDADERWRVPAFWSGDLEWRVRFAPPYPGVYRFHTACSDEGNAGLHGLEGTLSALPYEGDNPLFRHGPLRASASRRYLEHADGTPFFWLGDTWWMGLSKRLSWPDDFQELTADRLRKGFSVVQVVAGPYPDMPAFDPRNENEAGQPWETNFSRVNPAYYDMADLRLRWLVRSGIVPCILGSWGYYLFWMGMEALKKHWRHLIARYGAYPVVWCLAGEAAMPYYLSETKEEDRQALKEGWTDIGRYVERTDPFHRPITVHPTYPHGSREQVLDESFLSFDMLQTGHGGWRRMGDAARQLVQAVRRSPQMPVVNGEPGYEGITVGNGEETIRFLFWSTMLSGAAGYTYGANGVWQVNEEGKPYGPSPHGAAWGDTPWREAAQLPGSTQVGLGKRLLERYEWWRFQPRQDWVEPGAGDGDFTGPYAAGIPGEVRVIYFPQPLAPWATPVRVCGLEPEVAYSGFFFNPSTGKETRLGEIRPQAGGSWRVPLAPLMRDWVLVLERVG